MKIHPFTVAGAVALAALATQAAADYTIVSFKRSYSPQELAAICTQEGGLAYHSAAGVYGCTNGTNNVECRRDGNCTGYIQTPYAFTGAGGDTDVGAAMVLQTQLAPARKPVTGGTLSDSIAPQ